MAAAMQRIERRLGPVTAIGHAARTSRPRPVAELTEAEVRAHAAAETAGLQDLVSSIAAGRLRLHGASFDIRFGVLEVLRADGTFAAV